MKKMLRQTWLLVSIALLVGLVAGGLIARWHYKTLYKDYVKCGPISYYDRTGKIKLYSDSSCTQ